MPSRDRRVDAYIARSAAFARPVLEHVRAVVHEACPAVQEGIKWGMPYFMHHGMLCGMAAFQTHCVFGFWKGREVTGRDAGAGGAMGQFGRLATVKDLPPRRTLIRFVRVAMKLNETAAPAAIGTRRRRPPIPMPADLKAALARRKAALAGFDALPPGGRREYLEWITEAKRPDTRARRIATAVGWLAEGKSRNWRYERK